MKKLFYLIITGLVITSCSSKTESFKEAFGKIENMSQIGTVEYTITKLIIADDDAFYKIGARKTIFSCKVKAKAGVDMKDFTIDDVNINKANKSITVNLPYPTVLSFNMPAEYVKCEYTKVSGVRTDFNTEERNDLLKQGEAAIYNDLENLGIINDAKENATIFFQALLNQAGYSNVVINFKEKNKEDA